MIPYKGIIFYFHIMYFLSQIKLQCMSAFQISFEGPAVGPDARDLAEQDGPNLENLSPEERQRILELQQIQVELATVVNSREITEQYLRTLERWFVRVLDDVEDLTEEDLSDPNSDYNKLVNKITILRSQIQAYLEDEIELTQAEWRVQLLDLQGQTTAALQDLLGEVTITADIEMTSEDRADLFTQASENMRTMVDEIEWISDEQREFLVQIIESAGGLENISANDIYLMKSVGIDLASLFLVNSEGRARKDAMEEGDVFLVNFGGNYSVDRAIGAWDILDISNVYRVKINGIEWIRGHSPRPGYYTSDGRYLAIHDGYRLEVVEKREYSEDENAEDFENSTQSRIEEFRRNYIDEWMYENIFESEETQLEIPFVMDIDKQTFANYISDGMTDYVSFDEGNWVLSVGDGYDSFEDAFWEFAGSIGDFEARPNESLARNPAFLARLNEVCNALWVNPSHMLIVMRAESGINPNLENQIAVREGRPWAVWLIQFMPSTARWLGTSREALLGMSGIEQLEYVYRYFEPYAWRLRSVEDLYKATFFPAAIGQPLSWVFRSSRLSPQSIARENPWIARHSTRADGFIDGFAFRRYVAHHVGNA